ncbi:MAG: myo-inositol-1(or 4)-monophosphatase, partial [Parcubacteria group bacterium Gr01-1014_66]
MFSDETLYAAEIAKKAGKVVLGFHKRRLKRNWTSRHYFKTDADDASEKLIQRMIRARYTDYNVWSGEGGRSDKGSSYTWVWDAVDGTIPMYTGISDHFSVCGALCEGKRPILGVANAVGRGEFYLAEVGKG